jgi:hypothetical protein
LKGIFRVLRKLRHRLVDGAAGCVLKRGKSAVVKQKQKGENVRSEQGIKIKSEASESEEQKVREATKKANS